MRKTLLLVAFALGGCMRATTCPEGLVQDLERQRCIEPPTDGCIQRTFYRDADSDTFGDPDQTTLACERPDGWVEQAGDCDDARAEAHLGAEELCNGLDDDCDDMVDDGAPTSTPENCGGCGLRCPAGFECDGTMCVDRAVEVDAGADRGRVEAGAFVSVRGASGRVYLWGIQLASIWSLEPVALSGVEAASQVGAGGLGGCAVVGGGGVVCWDAQGAGAQPVSGLTGTRSVHVGGMHRCAVEGTGQLRCWGSNALGQLGVGDRMDRAAPTAVSLPAPVAEAVLGELHTCARLVSGAVWCWGRGAQGQLGTGSVADSDVPVEVPGLTASTLGGGAWTTCAGTASGVLCWGNSLSGENGAATMLSSPTAVAGYPAAPAITTITGFDGVSGMYPNPGGGGLVSCFVATAHTCSITQAQRAACWGANGHGQLGDGTSTPRSRAAQVPSLEGVTSLAVSGGSRESFSACPSAGSTGGFVCATNAAGEVLCWGRDPGNVIRSGGSGDLLTPQRVVGFPVRVPPSPT